MGSRSLNGSRWRRSPRPKPYLSESQARKAGASAVQSRGGGRDMRTREGTLEGRGRRFAVVASRFNGVVTEKLVEGALAAFRKLGIASDDIEVVWTPGAFEVPLAAGRLAKSGQFEAVVCLGAVIRGE